MGRVRLVSVVGARPQFVKAAVIAQAIQGLAAGRRPQHKLVHTGQHFDDAMSAVFFRDLPLPRPAHWLGVGGLPPAVQLGRMVDKLDRVLLKERPDAVIAYGDTTSTLAGALAAVSRRVPVAHVEAGLRSFNRRMPEETNRVLTDHVSRWLFCPSRVAARQLKAEGIRAGVHVSGDVMVDALKAGSGRVRALTPGILAKYGLACRGYYLATVHRAENTENARLVAAIFREMGRLDRPVVLPLHPRTRRLLEGSGLRLPASGALRVTGPLSYHEMLVLERSAAAILTDSGGVQKEAYFWGVPCLTLRDETEWVETVSSGWNRLIGFKAEGLRSAASQAKRGNPDRGRGFYGNGSAGKTIVRQLMKDLKG